MRVLDGTEVVRPETPLWPVGAAELREFFARERTDAGLRTSFPALPVPGAWRLFSRSAGVLGLLAMVLVRRKP
jgi:hypothetical protein